MHTEFGECSFIRYRDIEGVPNLNFKIGHVPQATLTWGANFWSAGKNSPGSTCTPNLKNVASSDTEILRGSQISFFPPAPLPLNRLGTKSIGFGGLLRSTTVSEFQVIPIKRFLSRALTYIQTYKHTYIQSENSIHADALRARRG